MTSTGSSVRRALARLVDLTALILCITAAIAMLSDTGFVGSRISRWRKDRGTVRAAQALKDEISRNGSIIGKGGAQATIIEIGDYECPFCRVNHAVVDSLLERGTQVHFVHYPLATHQYAERASLAVLCAGGTGAAEKLHRRFMSAPKWEAEPEWVALARDSGVSDTAVFRSCLHADSSRQRLAANVKLAARLAVTGTPTYIGQTAVVRGVASLEQLIRISR